MCFPVNKCCFCLSLKAGTKIISILSLVCSVTTVVVYAGAAWSVPPAAQAKCTFYQLVTAVSICQTVLAAMLIYGAFWDNPRYVWPWLVVSWARAGALLALSLLGAALLSTSQTLDPAVDVSTMTTVYFVYAVIIYYSALVVKSRRAEMMRAKDAESADELVSQQDQAKGLIV